MPTLRSAPTAFFFFVALGAGAAEAACPTGYVERYIDGVAEPECLSESELRARELLLEQNRREREVLSRQRAIRERQAATEREQRRLTQPR